MITATLITSASAPENFLTLYQAACSLARKERTMALTRARTRAMAYSRKAHESGYRCGYKRGLLEGKRKFQSLLAGLRAQYDATVERAQDDVLTIAHHIIERVIASYVEEHPEHIRNWISQALTGLRRASGMTLHYHPRYHHLIGPFIEELKINMKASADPTLGDIDFKITTNAGEIAFSWREMLGHLGSTLVDIEG